MARYPLKVKGVSLLFCGVIVLLEKNFNTIIRRSLEREGGFGFKIPDPNKAVFSLGSGAIKNPFDGFGVNPDRVVFWEAKIFSGKTFKVTELRDHQIGNLLKIWNMETVDFVNRVYLPIIVVGRKFAKDLLCYFILPEFLNKKGYVNLNDLSNIKLVKGNLMVGWTKKGVTGLTPICSLVEGQF